MGKPLWKYLQVTPSIYHNRPNLSFKNLCCYWDNQTDKTEGKIGRCIGVSYWVGSAICYWVLTEKVNIIVRTTVQYVTQYESENPEIQQSIRNYHMILESSIGAD